MDYVFHFDAEETAEITQVGGKAWSLIRMTQQGLPVPPGFVLAVDFFDPWYKRLMQTQEWSEFIQSPASEMKMRTETLKKRCLDFDITEERKQILEQALKTLEQKVESRLYAVRSSSPEEDLEGASFAGGYQTSLGVNRNTLVNALLACFQSSLDERIFVYKRELGFNIEQPKIAVIVQAQVASDTAGVAFSLNPVNNSYDEIVINANFGLGESVVSGMVSPDTFVVDKTSGRILEKKAGKKELSIGLRHQGGTYEKQKSHSAVHCLSDKQVEQLAELVEKIEKDYRKPMDIEWAYRKNELFLLQARPITAYIPLPEAMQTKPGEQKLLYLDETTVKQGINEPISVMGTALLSLYKSKIETATTGFDTSGVTDGLGGFYQGRMYANISNSIKLGGKGKLIYGYRLIDRTTADIISEINEKEYVPKILPEKLKGVIWGRIRNSMGIGKSVMKAMKNPQVYYDRFVEKAKEYTKELEREMLKAQSVKEFAEAATQRFVDFFIFSMPVIALSMLAQTRLQRIVKNEDPKIRDKVTYLAKSLPHNVTTQMGLAMYRLSCFSEIKEHPSFTAFKKSIEDHSFSSEFIDAWNQFMALYGFRGPKELDIASPRYYEKMELIYRQLLTLTENTDAHNPQTAFEEAGKDRENSLCDLLALARKKGMGRGKYVQKNYDLLVLFGGLREAPKYYWVMTVNALRRRVLKDAKTLMADRRLLYPEQVFDLTINDLEKAMTDPAMNLQSIIFENTAFLKKISNIRHFPRIIDSRGRILHPLKKAPKEGELAGEPISPGIVSGRVKVLNSPDEKPVLPGEILVTRATDPGWTPLFLNAAGIILEVGGMLQHGALVAREYGKPCVSGVENAVTTLTDGQWVELDGHNGIVKIH